MGEAMEIPGRIEIKRARALTGIDEASLLAAQRDTERQMAAPGELRLPELLDRRRLEYGLINDIFKVSPIFNAVYVFQLQMVEGETFQEGGLIVKTDKGKQRETEEAPRGILVGAGLRALDELRSHGVDLGHIVSFIKLAPFRVKCGYVAGKQVHVIVMRSGDIIGSEDIATGLREGSLVVANAAIDGTYDHRLKSCGITTRVISDTPITGQKMEPEISEDI